MTMRTCGKIIAAGIGIFVGGALIGYYSRAETKIPQDVTLRVNGKVFHLYWEITKVIQNTDNPWKE